ncbi:MAG: hypothetical protein JWP97_580 [Labilithrix sp.]|nr:hypothetical protein [Labilithrix sp.]
MTRRLCLVLALLLWAPSAHADAPSAAPAEESEAPTLFREGTAALASGRAVDAIADFEALGDRGVVDAVVSYDRGLAYAARVRAGTALEQPGDLGRAAHGFEEARELSHDAALQRDAARALAAVRAEVAKRRARTGDPIEVEGGVSLGRSIVRLLPEDVWAIVACLCAAALVVGIALRARARLPRLKVAGVTTAVISGGLLVLVALVMHNARNVRLHVRDAVIISPNARLLDAQHVVLSSVAALPEAARVELVDESSDFARVVAGHVEGYLPSSTILPLAK